MIEGTKYLKEMYFRHQTSVNCTNHGSIYCSLLRISKDWKRQTYPKRSPSLLLLFRGHLISGVLICELLLAEKRAVSAPLWFWKVYFYRRILPSSALIKSTKKEENLRGFHFHVKTSSWHSVPSHNISRYSSLSSSDACCSLWCRGR